MWQNFITQVGPPFFMLLGLVATAAITVGTNYVRKTWLNGAAQSAFANAAGGIVNQLGEELLKTALTPNHPEVAIAVTKVQARIPDVVKSLGLTPAGIAERIIDHVGKQQAPAIGALLGGVIPAMMPSGMQTGVGGPVR